MGSDGSSPAAAAAAPGDDSAAYDSPGRGCRLRRHHLGLKLPTWRRNAEFSTLQKITCGFLALEEQEKVSDSGYWLWNFF
ncbi:hypothetical protein AV530_012125 [Patagioenas fasciata monilis]|uniref:Uncharacterized protein n=1 Tax=Patagioenas fasciata monilis TaxID=372326 RepID=A0A1V4JUZ9_PATFA|nr:hypothetical protein AV530_012125 [Patagioenas fasciata monilis]